MELGLGHMEEELGCTRMVEGRVCRGQVRKEQGCMELGCKEQVRKGGRGVRGVGRWQRRLPREQREPEKLKEIFKQKIKYFVIENF